jgi:hypothetical protein
VNIVEYFVRQYENYKRPVAAVYIFKPAVGTFSLLNVCI